MLLQALQLVPLLLLVLLRLDNVNTLIHAINKRIPVGSLSNGFVDGAGAAAILATWVGTGFEGGCAVNR